VYLLVWLHLVALRNRFGYDFLVTLGDCRHLMAWSSGGALARVGDCSWSSPSDCEEFCAFSGGAPKATLVDCTCYWATSLAGRFLRYLSEDEVRATPLSRRTTKCWLTQCGRSVLASTWALGENLYVHLLWLIGFLLVIGLYYIDWFTCLYTSV